MVEYDIARYKDKIGDKILTTEGPHTVVCGLFFWCSHESKWQILMFIMSWGEREGEREREGGREREGER